MENTYKELTMSGFRRYYEESSPSRNMYYYNVNDRERSHFPANRTRQMDSPTVELSLNVEYIAFSFNPNRILIGNPGGVITFNRVEKIALFIEPWGETAYIFSKDSNVVHCVLFDKRYRQGKQKGRGSLPATQ